MRFVIYGAGGVGGVIGAQLFKGGEDVVLIARGAHLTAVQRDGLHLQTPALDERLAIPAVEHPSQVAAHPDNVFILTCKSQHTRGALEDLRATHGDQVAVVCGQNGVVNERAALRRFARVYAMLIYLPAQMIDPGHIQCHAKRSYGVLDVGRYPGSVDGVCRELARRLEAVNFSVRPDPHVMRLKYAKLLSNLNNALDAITSKGPGYEALRSAACTEGEACLRAAGIEWASAEDIEQRLKDVYEHGEIPGATRVGGSSRQSLLRGTGDIEADYLNGEIVQLGRLHDVPTPVNSVLQRLAVDLALRKAQPGSIDIETVQRLVEAERSAQRR
ncbi:MAG: ketopantoate reductase family protein [Gammaproteobacteria bacterium]|nr:ketopantoate reductase family protein [Gammaproteobacteria bacterium]